MRGSVAVWLLHSRSTNSSLTNARSLFETTPAHVMQVKKERSIVDEEICGEEREEEEMR
jgi:hypothetical protein